MSAGAGPAVNIWGTRLSSKPKQIWGKIHRKHLVWQRAALITSAQVGFKHCTAGGGEKEGRGAQCERQRSPCQHHSAKDKVESLFGLNTGSSKLNKIHLLTHIPWNVESPRSKESISDPNLCSLQHRAAGRWPAGNQALAGKKLLLRVPPPFFFVPS